MNIHNPGNRGISSWHPGKQIPGCGRKLFGDLNVTIPFFSEFRPSWRLKGGKVKFDTCGAGFTL
jgi:hypothetical protein